MARANGQGDIAGVARGGPRLLVVLDRLNPAERIAFVQHYTFAVSFEEIGSIVGRSPVAARQLASRARRRVQGVGTASRSRPYPETRVVGGMPSTGILG